MQWQGSAALRQLLNAEVTILPNVDSNSSIFCSGEAEEAELGERMMVQQVEGPWVVVEAVVAESVIAT